VASSFKCTMSAPSAEFKRLLNLLSEQYEKDMAKARKDGMKERHSAERKAVVDPADDLEEVQAIGPADFDSPSPVPRRASEAKMAFGGNDPGSMDKQDVSKQVLNELPGMTGYDSVVPNANPQPPAANRPLRMQTDIVNEENARGSVHEQISQIQELMARDRAENLVPVEGLRGIVRSETFDRASSAVLIMNGIFIGIQVAQDYKKEMPTGLKVIDYIFCVLFLAELGLRLVGLGCKEFWLARGEDRYWNWFDFFIVTASTFDAVLSIALESSGQSGSTALSNISVLRVIRVVRVVRVLRIIKVLSFFRDLRVLMMAIVSTVKTASFAFGLIMFVMYIFGIALTQVVGEHLKEQWEAGNPVPDDSPMMFFFGSVPNTILCLFMTIAGGIDWLDAIEPLLEIGAIPTTFFLIYVVLMVLCIMNVLLGIFCQCALDTAAQDRENVIQTQLQDRARFISTLGYMFAEWDESGDGKCSLAEFNKHLADDKTQALLRSLEIDSRDALAIFEMLDADHNGSVDLNEFITGCITLRGGAKAVQLEKVNNFSKDLHDRFDKLDSKVNHVDKRVSVILTRMLPDTEGKTLRFQLGGHFGNNSPPRTKQRRSSSSSSKPLW